jgi:arylsulfatase A-like enzyme
MMLCLVGCTCQTPRPEAIQNGAAISLLELQPASLTLPDQSRPNAAPPQSDIPLDARWKYVHHTSKGMYKYRTSLPIRPRGLFFHRGQPGLSLKTKDGTDIAYARYVKRDHSFWWHDRTYLYLLSPEKRAVPERGEFTLHYDKAVEREQRLNFSFSGKTDPFDFARIEINDGWKNRLGLLLPAPAMAEWDFTVPPAAEFTFVLGMVEPEIQEGAPSEGAWLEIFVEDEQGVKKSVQRIGTKPGSFEDRRLDLSAWSGQAIRLTLESQPGERAVYDYLFVGDPIVSTRKLEPRRVVMVFIDTLRPDHLSLYGYDRPTSPKLDAFASEAVVFTQARSVAPWTLPSARSVLTGRHPEYYDSTPTLPARLRREGFTSAMFAGNVYLSANFGMTRDWGLHTVGLWPSAKEVTDDALAWLETHEGQDVLLQVHYMDPHLPYKEPGTYRHLFAGDGCCGLREEFHLSDVRKAHIKTDEDKQYIKDRYDNNIRYATDQIDRLFQILSPQDVVIVYADHGEEFWDHRQFEHGHSLFDELLRVPLVISGPGLKPARLDTPVSLLDVTPTILDMLGLETSGPFDGASLTPLMRGEEFAKDLFETRNLAFGRPLYGTERWGVVSGERKWTTHEGREALYDLEMDGLEQNNLLRHDQTLAGPELREAMGRALGREAPVSYRLVNTPYRLGTPNHDLVVTVHVPGGVAQHWVGDDPLNQSSASTRMIDEEHLEVRWHKGFRQTREVYFVPVLPIADTTHQLHFDIVDGDAHKTMFVPKSLPAQPGKVRTPFIRATLPQRVVALTWGLAPAPNADTQALEGRDDEMNELLEAMGYVDRDETPEP